MRKPWLLLAGTSLVAALGAWAACGVLAPSDLSVVPRRVGLLPAWWWLAGAAALVAALLAWRPKIARGPWWLALLLLLPWLPLPVPPAFLLWTGPIAWWIWAAILVAVLVASWQPQWSSHVAVRNWSGSPRRGPLVAAAVALACYLAGARLISNVLPAGDEPHYLVITQSLLKDHDLKIENNHRQEDYIAYFRGVLKPDYLRRGRDGEIYSIHAPGLPAVVLPAFALAGYPGVIVFLALISALGTWLVWRSAYLLTGSVGAAWFGWAVAAFGAPFYFHAFTAYPDGVGAVIAMSGVYSLVRLELARRAADGTTQLPPGRTWWVAQGLLLALLPWLHTRYAGAAGVLGLAIGLRLLWRKDVSAVAALSALPVLSAAAWFGSFYVIYGEFNPAAPYGDYTQTQASNIPRGLVGLFFDQQFGILPNAPAYLFGLAGLVVMLRRRARLSWELTLLFFSYLALVAVYHMWWGGWSAPARFAVPVLLMLGLPAAAWWATRGPAGKAIGSVGLGLTILITLTLVLGEDGRLIFNDRDGHSRWLEWVSPLVDVPRAFPSFFRTTPASVLWHAGTWAGIFGLAALGLWRLAGGAGKSGEEGRRRLALAAPALFAVALMAGTSLSWWLDAVVAVTPTSAQLRWVDAFDPSAHSVGVQYKPLRLAAPSELVSRLQIGNSRRRALPDDYPLLLLPGVPAGIYRLAPASVMSLRGQVDITIGRSPQPVLRWNFDEMPRRAEYLLRLPVAVDAVVIQGDARARQSSATPLALVPVSLSGPQAGTPAWRASRAANYGTASVFAPGESVYLEDPGFWVEGGVSVSVALAVDDRTTPLALLVRNGATANVVHLRSGGWNERLDLQPREERVVRVPMDGDGMARLEVRAERGFRPADVEPASRDLRYLGAWLQPRAPGDR